MQVHHESFDQSSFIFTKKYLPHFNELKEYFAVSEWLLILQSVITSDNINQDASFDSFRKLALSLIAALWLCPFNCFFGALLSFLFSADNFY